MLSRSRFVVLVLSLASFAPGCATNPVNPTSVRATIDRKNSEIEQLYANKDVEPLVHHFASDAWQMPPNNPPVVGRDAIRAFWKQAFGWGAWEFSLKAGDVQVNGPIAVERGSYTLLFTAGPGAPPGMTSSTDRGNYVCYWRREADGEWRIVWDAPVSQLPPPQIAR